MNSFVTDPMQAPFYFFVFGVLGLAFLVFAVWFLFNLGNIIRNFLRALKADRGLK